MARLAAERGAPPPGFGVGAPGLAAADGRSIAFMQGRLAGLQGLDWAGALETPAPVRVLNDAHAALLGEAWTGAAAGCREVVLLTLGTGVGGAILSGGRLVLGATGRAGHWGHISLDPDGPPSITGMPGSLEGAIGNCTVAARTDGRFTDTRALVEAHLAGDPLATRVWRRSVRDLAVAIASIANAVDPELVVIGGGIARAGAALFEPLAEDLAAVEWRPLGRRVRVRAGGARRSGGRDRRRPRGARRGVRMTASPGEQYLDAARGLVETVRAQREAIQRAADWFAATILAGRMVHVFGAGHSRILVEEMWPRYGSFPGFNPIVELSLTFHNLVVGANGQRQAMFLENVSGLAERILRNFALAAEDAALVVSSSGGGVVAVEMAEGFRARGIRVVAIVSRRHAEATPSRDAARPARHRLRRPRPRHRRARGRRDGRDPRALPPRSRPAPRSAAACCQRHQGRGRGAAHRRRPPSDGADRVRDRGRGALGGALRSGLRRARAAAGAPARPPEATDRYL